MEWLIAFLALILTSPAYAFDTTARVIGTPTAHTAPGDDQPVTHIVPEGVTVTLQTCTGAASVPSAAAPGGASPKPESWCLVRGVGWVRAERLDGSAALLNGTGQSATDLARKLIDGPATDPMTLLQNQPTGDDTDSGTELQ